MLEDVSVSVDQVYSVQGADEPVVWYVHNNYSFHNIYSS